jgi:hypothetical protein
MTTTLNASTAGAGGFIATSDNSGSLALQTAGTTAVTIDTSQNVGIGTTSPSTYSSKFAVVSSGVANTWLMGGSGSGAYAYFSNNAQSSASTAFQIGQGWNTGSDNIAFINNNNASPLVFATSGTERMRIDSSGSLLVGTTTTLAGPAAGTIQNLTAVSTNSFYTKNSNATPYGIEVQYSGAAPNGTGSPFLECFDTSTTRVVFRSNGGLANYSANNVNLSDQREKKDIELAPSYLSKICQIPVKTFLFNDQTDTDLNLGAIAQDVQAVCPELVMESNWAGKGEPEKMRLSIYQTDLQYALMKSIQELKAINDTQAETINALTARIVALESRGTV